MPLSKLTPKDTTLLKSLSNQFQIHYVVLDEENRIHEIAAEELPLYVSLFDEIQEVK